MIACAIRIIPEIKAGIWPIGYDTFNTYAAELSSYSGSLIDWLKTANLIYFIFLPFKLMGIESGLIMKIFGPLFFGGLVGSFYYWARNFIGFSKSKALVASLLIIFQIATLRLSWDLYRNELGLIFLFLALIYLAKISKNVRNLAYFLIFGLGIVFSNELVTAIFILICVVYLVYLLFKKKYQESLKLFIVLVIVNIIFWGIVVITARQNLYDVNVLFISGRSYILKYFYQYLNDMSYIQLKSDIWQVFWLFYKFFIPFAIYGFWLLRKNLVLTSLTLWLLFATFSSLIFNGVGVIYWERWLIMLSFPIAIYTVDGIFHLGILISRIKVLKSQYKKIILISAILFWVIYLGLLTHQIIPFISADYNEAKAPLANDRLNNYFPRTMIHNSIGMENINDSLKCIRWLDQNVSPGSVILVDNRWRGLMLTNLDLDSRYVITSAWSNNWPSQSFNSAKSEGFDQIYLIWFTKTIKGFSIEYTSNDVSIYKATYL